MLERAGFVFFFQAEDGIRDLTVTGVQTCALPISGGGDRGHEGVLGRRDAWLVEKDVGASELLGLELVGRADGDRKSTRLNSSHSQISYAVFCLKKNT